MISRPVKLAVFATHPIQYQIPWFQYLAKQKELDPKVFFTSLPDSLQQGVGFGIPFQWDVPLLEGYSWQLTSPLEFDGILKEKKLDVAIITGWHAWPLLMVLGACVRFGIPRIVRGESNSLRMRPWWVSVGHRLLLKQYNAFLAIGKANREFYLKNGIDPYLIFECPYFVDNARFRSQFCRDLERRNNLRVMWDIPSDSVCFIYVGKLQAKKRILDLLQAVRLAVPKNRKIHLLVVGTGELMSEAKKQTNNLSLPVTFAGFLNQTEITQAYAAGDCLVLPSDFGETWGLVVNEAMVCRMPAIVSDRVGCGADLVEEGRTGAVFPFGNIQALTERMLQFASDPSKLRTMGTYAEKKIRSYSVEKATQGALAAIEIVLR